MYTAQSLPHLTLLKGAKIYYFCGYKPLKRKHFHGFYIINNLRSANLTMCTSRAVIAAVEHNNIYNTKTNVRQSETQVFRLLLREYKSKLVFLSHYLCQKPFGTDYTFIM